MTTQPETAHRHVCSCGESWRCTKRDCDIPIVTDCTRCALARHEAWAQSSGYIRIEGGTDERQRCIPE